MHKDGIVSDQLPEEVLEIISQSAAQTQHLGKLLGELLRGKELLLLDGNLGAGKTTFTQGLAQGMGIAEVINSPTFTLLKEYAGRSLSPSDVSDSPLEPMLRKRFAGRLALYHFDLYRLNEPDELFDLGFDDYFASSGVCVVEWADKADEFWPPERLYIRLQLIDEVQRRLLFVATGSRYCELLRQFQKNIYATTSS
ncbi:tRNA (adenosine(37)-N6)-threonylcarbamoyltransferase complex ATPase subunit type 1 TsaE [Reticulibacter mediterranei]|uniref:tRNA (adenosine(37)-N6)-threonylcarbamoyltransferase complex ATPase subunit type 1 TsaE n=1 Tax=Reticulibacter mediterranei TaxID=2778369 RepID=UPI001C692090|nr:tRNA (adenosine(37)-N6)-threonylcarbamoyltransferase complex ATPase subunit type 1 TsaE [Reticulibacter mediterranei]